MNSLMIRMLQTGLFAANVGRRLSKNKPSRSDGLWLRQRIQEMGPTYIKIGQFISSRKDIFDKEIIESLNRLQDNVDPLPCEIVQELVKDLEIMNLESKPIASASMGQVHMGRLKGKKRGTFIKVVAKIKRPGIEEILEADVNVLLAFCTILEMLNRSNNMSGFKETREIIEDFRDSIMNECNFINEISNMRMFARSVANVPTIVVPRVVKSLCNNSTIVMQYVPSIKFKDAKEQMTVAQRKQIAYSLMDAFVQQLVKDGIIHGDPHEGNVALTPDFERFVFYDFGNIITIDKDLRQQMIRLVFELMTDNVDGSINVLRNMRQVSVRDETSLRLYVSKYTEYMRTVDVTIFQNMMASNEKETYAKLPVKFDAIIFRIIRVFGLVEGICKDLDPSFNYSDVFSQYANSIFMDSEFIDYKARSDMRLFLNGVIGILKY